MVQVCEECLEVRAADIPLFWDVDDWAPTKIPILTLRRAFTQRRDYVRVPLEQRAMDLEQVILGANDERAVVQPVSRVPTSGLNLTGRRSHRRIVGHMM